MTQIKNNPGFLTFVYEYSVFDNEPKKDLDNIAYNVTNKIEFYRRFKAFPFMDYKSSLFLDEKDEEESTSGILKFTLIGLNKDILRCIDEIVSSGLEPDYFKRPNIIKSLIHNMNIGLFGTPETHTYTYLLLEEHFKNQGKELPEEKDLFYSNARLLYD